MIGFVPAQPSCNLTESLRSGESFPDDQAFIEFNDAFAESLEDLTESQRIEVLAEVLTLCKNPAGNHPLSNRSGQKLAGWNTLDVLEKEYRVIFSSRMVDGDDGPVGLVEVLVVGQRKASAAYDMADALVRSNRLTPDEALEFWEYLALLEIAAEQVGLDGWDYQPEPAPDGLAKAAVAAGILDEHTASLLSKDELNAAMAGGWSNSGQADPDAALRAALERARSRVDGLDLSKIVKARQEARCGSVLPRTGRPCIRRQDHPGPHRTTV